MKTARLVFAIILLLCLGGARTQQIFVFDDEGILSKKEERKLNKLFIRHESKTTNEILLMVTSEFEGIDPLEFATELGNSIGVGKKDKDNGVVILISSKLRRTAIATGLGIEDILTDEDAKRIIDKQMIPHFKKGNYFDGLWAGSTAIVDHLEKQ